jgi:drug/metabolite transporter (DMT)-like permease
MWFTFALISAIFAAIRRTRDKQLSQKFSTFALGWSMQLFCLPVMALALIISHQYFNPFTLGIRFWLPCMLLWFGFYPLNSVLYTGAIKHGELSKVLPLQSLGPIFALGIGWALFRQRPSVSALLAIGITVSGIYVLNMNGRCLHNPLTMFHNDKPSRNMALSMLLIAACAALDKVAINASSPIFFSFVSTLGAAPTLVAASRITNSASGFKLEFKEVCTNAMPLAISGTMLGVSFTAYSLAIQTGPLAYVSAVRSSSIVMGAAIGFAYLNETATRSKLVALVLISSGVVILGISQ